LTVGARPAVAAPAAGAAHEGGQLVDGDELALLVEALRLVDDDGVLALVVDVLDPRLVGELLLRRQRSQQLGVLLAVEDAIEPDS
jgi:hypothetical protein